MEEILSFSIKRPIAAMASPHSLLAGIPGGVRIANPRG